MKSARLHTKGFTLIASLLMLLLLSGIAIGLMMMVNTEGKVGGTDLQNNLAYHAAEGGIEKMYSDLSAVFQNIQAPSASDICEVSGTNYQPTMVGITWENYSVAPQGLTCPTTAALTANWGNISSGQNEGLYAQIIPVNMLATASETIGGQEVSMARTAQVALIPVFQFGMFCEGDCSIFPGSGMTFAGPVHSNGDFYPFVGSGANLTFQGKVSAYGNIVRTVLPNTNTAAAETGTVFVPTSGSATACSNASPGAAPSTATTPTNNHCTSLASVSTSSPWGDGSVEGLGGNPPQSTYIPSLPPAATDTWSPFSTNTTSSEVINGNYGNKNVGQAGTGAKKLSLPFVNGTNFPYEIIRRPPGIPVGNAESPTSLLGQSRQYNMAQIHVLLDDDPADLPGGASDTNNVRLVNLTPAQVQAQYGLSTLPTAGMNQWGIPMAAGNYVSTTFGTPAAGNTYNLYFAAASNVVPVPSSCADSTDNCSSDDWPYEPQPFAGQSATQGLQPAGAPTFLNNDPTHAIPAVQICPPAVTVVTLPVGCPNPPTGAYPYYPLPNPSLPVVGSALTPYNSANANAWSLIDGYLRVEYQNSSGAWVPVTNEWLALGFARGVTAPTANGAGLPVGGTSNPINPNAILLLQEPADRLTTAPANLPTICIKLPCSATVPYLSAAGTAPVCTTWNNPPHDTVCKVWSGTLPQLSADSLALSTGTATGGVTGIAGDWAFGLTPTATSTTTTPQSITMYNWYPINFYDAREGENRDINWSTVNGVTDNSCTTNGVMNAVEIDVGNLQQWLLGNIGVNLATGKSSGPSVDSSKQNGYILYFSDRRGMLVNPNGAPPNAVNTKSGDAGLEDTINASSAAGTPDGSLETKMTGQAYSPEDDNENNALDNWGAQNLGLGFYGTVASAAQNLNAQIISTNPKPDPYGTIAAAGGNRINSCGRTGRKNWVSGARHVLKLVDGSLGNVPLSATPVTYNGVTYNGGFTVASENPVYIQGDYNSNAGDSTWATPPVDKSGQAAAAVIADAVTILSNKWDDRVSMLGVYTSAANFNYSPTNVGNRPAGSTYYRVAIAAGKNMTFKWPSAWAPADDVGTDGGIHNFLRLLENWGVGGVTENYKGSLASLYYATYNTGFYKCCTAVYGVPTRNFYFDLDFQSPGGLPPGTPMFRDVESLGYRQIFTTRLAGQ